ncbi:MAG: GDP-mannose 4,6-dehydratase [Kiritimatiellaeota bacterium]|nr:GDP-mannose 4,6-dehydratase [Kiritimatiellota bacterium]
MRVLVTGANGFVGRHTVHDLQQAGHTVSGFDLSNSPANQPTLDIHAGDIQDKDAVNEVVAQTRPEACVHLSALSFVPEGWRNPEALFSINLLGTIHLLEAFRRLSPGARILVVSSAEVYGLCPRPRPVQEDDLLDPDNPYAISKAAADRLALLYARQHGMMVMTVRPYNHIGPGQAPHFVVASFAAQLVAIASRQTQAPAVLKVGNLDSRRDFSDVRDVARAYRLLLEHGQPGRAYNLCSQQTTTIRAILDQLCDLSGAHPAVEVDPQRYRPAGERPALDTTRIETDIHWKPEIPMSTTLRDILAEATRALHT